MPLPIVTQLRFARYEFTRCLQGVTAADGAVRLGRMNSIGWIVGHLACQEQFMWVECAQGKVVVPDLNDIAGFGQPASTPPLEEMWPAWRAVTEAADAYLDELAAADLDSFLTIGDQPARETVGHWMLRNIYHYWFHTGEGHAIRQSMGHNDLPQFVGNVTLADYRPDGAVQ